LFVAQLATIAELGVSSVTDDEQVREQSFTVCRAGRPAVLIYENATHRLRNVIKTPKIKFTKAQEKDIRKRTA